MKIMETSKPSPQRPIPQGLSVPRRHMSEQYGQSSFQASANKWNPSSSSIAFSPSTSFTKPFKSVSNVDGVQDGSIRYVNVRVAIPANTPPGNIADYVQSSFQLQQSKQAEETSYDRHFNDGSLGGMPYNATNKQSQGTNLTNPYLKSGSSYAFVPIESNTMNESMSTGHSQYLQSSNNQFRHLKSSSPFTPMQTFPATSFGKDSPSPSMMTLETAEMTEFSGYSYCYSTPTSSRICSPFVISSPPLFKELNQHDQRPSSTTSFQSSIGDASAYCQFVSIVPDSNLHKTINPMGVSVSGRVHSNAPTGRRSPAFPNGRKSPTKTIAASGEEDEVRKCRIKTELCMHYINGTVCPFGSICTYAHGEEELQMTKLMDLHEAGLVDMDTYRIKPCLTWVTTGSCPFGKRCACIHDPRISSSQPSWLPHTETQGNTISTDINVESLHQKRLNTILYNNPFGIEKLSPGNVVRPENVNDLTGSLRTQWKTLYNLVTGSGADGWKLDSKQSKKAGRQIHPIVKLQIAIKMREETSSEWQYKYRPQHFVHGEFCMVLSKRAFRILNDDGSRRKLRHRNVSKKTTGTTDMEVIDIPVTSYNPECSQHIMVREIAFGPDCDPSVRGVALWFHIEEGDISVCTPQQAKRFRWKKGIKNNKNESNDGMNQFNVPKPGAKPSPFDSQSFLECFPMIRPQDTEAYELVTDILKHRLSVLRTERMSNMKERYDSLRVLESNEQELQQRFLNLQRAWTTWAWPVNRGREYVDENTPVPAVDGYYKASTAVVSDDENYKDSASRNQDVTKCEKQGPMLGSYTTRIWDSFVSTVAEEMKDRTSLNVELHLTELLCTTKRRLNVFERLANEEPICKSDRSLPHIKRSYKGCSSLVSNKKLVDTENHQERCWKALLLEPTEETGIRVCDGTDQASSLKSEWDIVLDHFENSRSKKVLSIIQQ